MRRSETFGGRDFSPAKSPGLKTRPPRWLISAAVLLSLPVALVAQQRDAAPPQVAIGTAEIAGIVEGAETTPQPIRRAVVTLTGLPIPRSMLTDDAGRFAFRQLPPGTYQVTARKASYLAAPYGARRPGRTGTSISLADAARSSIRIQMFKGAAITGTLRDASGNPIAGVDVRAMDARTLLTNPDGSPVELATTDDRGVFRIFGLLPGDYYVVALPQMPGQGEVVAPGAAHNDAALAMLASRSGTQTSQPPPAVLSQRLAPVGFAPVFYPGTPNHYEAARVRVESGEERAGVNFEMRSVPIGAIEGVVTGAVPNLAAVRVSLIPTGPRVVSGMSSNSLSGRPIDAQGTFRYSNLPPGRYRIVAQLNRAGPDGPGAPTVINGVAQGRGGGSGTPAPNVTVTTGPPTDFWYGFADVELRGEEVTNVSLDLQPGGVVIGRIVFAGGTVSAKPADVASIRPSLRLESNTGGMVSSGGLTMGDGFFSTAQGSARSDGTFEIRGIGPGRFTLAAAFLTATEAGAWKLRSAVGGGKDLLDDAIEILPGSEVRDIVVTFSDARTEIAGTLQTGSGAVTTDYYIVALPAERALWRPRARRILSVRPATDGRFEFGDIPAGDYVIAALTDLDPLDLLDMTFLEQIAPAGVKVTVAEGERKVQDLRIR